MGESPKPGSVFDRYAESYDHALACGLSVSGEDKEYFARGRIAWLASCLRGEEPRPADVMDYGCGSGSSTPLFFEVLEARSLAGVDVSRRSLEEARRRFGADRADFFAVEDYTPREEIDLVFCNGIFHHVAPEKRREALGYVFRCLRPGGWFSFWENNPWNPGARLVMSRIPFDRDAVMIRPGEARLLLRATGFEVVRTDFLFIFPRFLRWLRWGEPHLAKLPLGAQYQVLCRKR